MWETFKRKKQKKTPKTFSTEKKGLFETLEIQAFYNVKLLFFEGFEGFEASNFGIAIPGSQPTQPADP